jgi:hypothetical protein
MVSWVRVSMVCMRALMLQQFDSNGVAGSEQHAPDASGVS